MRALVVGGGGFVGGYLVEHLLACGDQVWTTTVGQAPSQVAGSQHPNLQSLTLDITDSNRCAEVLKQSQPDAVYLLAGIAFVPEAESNFEHTLKVNVAGAANVLRQCHLANRGITALFVSSAEIYGAVPATALPISEQTKVKPIHNYGLSKRMAELVVDRYHRTGSIKGVIARPFNHIGAGQDPRFVVSNFAQQLAKIARKESPPQMSVGNLLSKRDFSDVRDIVRAYRLLVEHTHLNPPKEEPLTVTLASGVARSIESVLHGLIEVAGVEVDVSVDASRVRGPEASELYGSYETAKNLVGWEPQIAFNDSLSAVYQYWYQRS